jgi:hypothetical protein
MEVVRQVQETVLTRMVYQRHEITSYRPMTMQDDRPGGRAIGPRPHFVVGAAVHILGGAHVQETPGNVRSHKVLLVCAEMVGNLDPLSLGQKTRSCTNCT